jgi:hypothetical protein
MHIIAPHTRDAHNFKVKGGGRVPTANQNRYLAEPYGWNNVHHYRTQYPLRDILSTARSLKANDPARFDTYQTTRRPPSAIKKYATHISSQDEESRKKLLYYICTWRV